MIRVLFICMGNICRSPLAEGIFLRQAKEQGMTVVVDSAAIGRWHIGELPDPRAICEGESRGCEMTMRARQVKSDDFQNFDLIVAMDHNNVRALLEWDGAVGQKVKLARSFDASATAAEVPDPYYGTPADFTTVADMLELACEGLLTELAATR